MSYESQLRKDKRLAPLLNRRPYVLKKRKNTAIRLIASIISQQLSTQVAAIIFKRFLEVYEGKEPSMQVILNTSHNTLRGIGLSNSKVNYIKNVADFFLTHSLTDKQLYAMEPFAVIDLLTQIKGVGRWTVEMLLMFSLGHEDVFAVDDLGIQQAMIRLYKIKYTTKKELQAKMLKRSLAWAPYRTYACLHLWNWKDTRAV